MVALKEFLKLFETPEYKGPSVEEIAKEMKRTYTKRAPRSFAASVAKIEKIKSKEDNNSF